MSSSVATSYAFKALSVETLGADDVPAATAAKISHNSFDVEGSLSAATTPPVSFCSHQTISLSASGSIDFAALPTVQGVRSALGKKLVLARVHNRSPTHSFSLAVGASNGYAIAANAIVVPPLGCAQLYFDAALAASDGTHKTLDYAYNATAGNEADVTLVLG